MKLKEYYQNRNSFCNIFTDAELKQDISNLLGISVFVENPALKSIKEKKQILIENHDKILGFAYYLLDYQGIHDQVFESQIELFRIFAGMIFLKRIPFADAEHRLLEISQKYELATVYPEKENVANFILGNIEKFSQDELKQICHKIEKASVVEFLGEESVQILYKICRSKTSWLSKFF